MSTDKTATASLATVTKLWRLLDIGMQDFKVAAADPAIRIDMTTWHSPTQTGKCHICLAGAVMRGRLHVPDSKRCQPFDFDSKTTQRLFALDDLRVGNIESAWLRLHRSDANTNRTPSKILTNRAPSKILVVRRWPVHAYEMGPDLWLRSMADLLEFLEKNDL